MLMLQLGFAWLWCGKTWLLCFRGNGEEAADLFQLPAYIMLSTQSISPIAIAFAFGGILYYLGKLAQRHASFSLCICIKPAG